MTARLNPSTAADAAGTLVSATLTRGNVIYTVRPETADLDAVVVDRFEFSADGAVMIWLRTATQADLDARRRARSDR